MATNLNVAEIKRKAEAGIPLTNPTPEAMALYNQYKSASGSSSSQSSTSSSSNLNVAEIQRKAQLGIPLANPTPEATAGPLSIDWTHGIEKITQHNGTFVRIEWV
jgi:hypothetical protein